MEELIQEQLGDNFGYEWTSVAYQETKAGSTPTMADYFRHGVASRFLGSLAQYESWTSPLAAIMGLPIALLGAIIGCWVMGVPVKRIYSDRYYLIDRLVRQRHCILIVEFARDFRKEKVIQYGIPLWKPDTFVYVGS